MSFYERKGYVCLFVSEVYYRNQVLAELGKVGIENEIHCVRIPGPDAMMISFPGSAAVAYRRIVNRKLFGWT